MTERVARLRQQSLDAVPAISTERAELITKFYQNTRTLSVPVKRALAFAYILEHKEILINPGELIVGERGPVPKATYTYPEICCHSSEDLHILDTRAKTPFVVSEEAKAVYRDEIEPFWRGRTMRQLIFNNMTQEWLDAYEAGVFTEFMEQRAPGHTVLDDKIYHRGFLGLIQDIEASLAGIDYLNDPQAYNKQEELTAMRISAEAIIAFAQRYSRLARELVGTEPDPTSKQELLRIAEVCAHVPAHPPRDLWEALQSYWFVHLGVITELNPWDAFCPGRLDQHLYAFYRKGLEDGTFTEAAAKELLQCFWVKFNNHPAPPKVGVTAAESGTYADFANINIGGLKSDGSDGVNDLSYLLLEVVDELRLVQPSSNIQLSRKNPDAFLNKACRVIRKGWGQPAIFNADMIVKELLNQGKSVVDARNGGASGCVETGAFGKESYILTGYFNLVKVLEITLHNGVDPRTGREIGLRTGDPRTFSVFSDLLYAYRQQLRHFVDIKLRGNQVIERMYAEYLPVPFLSLLIDDCIKQGRDYHDGGARYNTNYIQGVGIGSLADCLSAIKHHLFEQRAVTMDELLDALRSDFQGNERLRQLVLNKTPKYGNDDDRADELARLVFDLFHQAVDGRPNTKGGFYRINLLSTTCHVYFGSVVGATPDGRRSGQPLSEGMSPVQGADRSGPTAVIRSAAKVDQIRAGGTLLNQKFSPAVLQGEEGIANLAHLVRTYFALDGHHVQFNVIDKHTLLAAQKEPEKHADLIVRVAGYSDYFNDLSKSLQDEIIARTEHQVL